MKGIRLFFAACLAPLAFGAAVADDAGDIARAAARRPVANSAQSDTAISTRGKTGTNTTPNKSNATATPSAGASRALPARERTDSAPTTTAGAQRGTTTATRAMSTTTNARTTGNVVSRTTASNVTLRTGTPAASTPTTAARTATTVTRTGAPTNTSRTATRNMTTTARTATGAASRAALPIAPTGTSRSRAATIRGGGARISRAGTLTREELMGRNYSNCKNVYYECMDEFCANKDAQLKRCACSTRVNEFDGLREQLTAVEDKMLDFSQRLLTVNMDKEDALAINQATEGELAFQQADRSESKKLLDQIAKKLNTSFDNSNFDTGAGALNWSLNIDAAFDNVDSLAGAATTTKTGTALYAAALPICRDVAAEVCSDEELTIAESGYQIAIEQDCNTVQKTYQTQIDQAREKVREGGALLDISRLDIYQTRNSDDILACKKKMLDMLTDTTVCGDGLGKCLDTTGQYIDPSTGAAFLTVNLVNLSTLLTRPTGNQTWTSAPGNQAFVTYLNGKKRFLEPAMENCQDIADIVWDGFIDDALSQIKLAQDAKLEEMRQGCTTLTAQCLTNASDSLADFDARALSIFGVAADKTAAAMCTDVRNACTALLESSGGTEWTEGMTEIATDTTYDTIINTCREVGRACIINACKSISGNFGLCESTGTSNNRKAIINRTSCWHEVVDCVASAGVEKIDDIVTQLIARGAMDADYGWFYANMYGYSAPNIKNEPLVGDARQMSMPAPDPMGTTSQGTTTQFPTCNKNSDKYCIYDICHEECGCRFGGGNNWECDAVGTTACRVCRISERIWGNCQTAPAASVRDENNTNQILQPIDTKASTLLYWLALNTGTQTDQSNCRSTLCGTGYSDRGGSCLLSTAYKNDCEECDDPFTVATDPNNNNDEIKNCCAGDAKTIDIPTGLVGTHTVTMCFLGAPQNPIRSNHTIPIDDNEHFVGGDTYLECVNGEVVYDYDNEEKPTINCKGGYFVMKVKMAARDTYVPYSPYYDDKEIYGDYVTYEFGYVPQPIDKCANNGETTTYKFDPEAAENGYNSLLRAEPTMNGWGWSDTQTNLTGWKIKYGDAAQE